MHFEKFISQNVKKSRKKSKNHENSQKVKEKVIRKSQISHKKINKSQSHCRNQKIPVHLF